MRKPTPTVRILGGWSSEQKSGHGQQTSQRNTRDHVPDYTVSQPMTPTYQLISLLPTRASQNPSASH